MGLLTDKTAVVTGGSSDIGLATAQRFIDEGAIVIITGRRRAELDAAATKLGSHAHAVPGDVTVPADLERLYEAAARLGGIDILFANAVVGHGAPLGSISEEHLQLLFDINVKGVVFTVSNAAPFDQRARLDHLEFVGCRRPGPTRNRCLRGHEGRGPFTGAHLGQRVGCAWYPRQYRQPRFHGDPRPDGP
jgi:NAD(P)-dependent dehydrogenase (short-subunit alcohol dehydrogenase family)